MRNTWRDEVFKKFADKGLAKKYKGKLKEALDTLWDATTKDLLNKKCDKDAMRASSYFVGFASSSSSVPILVWLIDCATGFKIPAATAMLLTATYYYWKNNRKQYALPEDAIPNILAPELFDVFLRYHGTANKAFFGLQSELEPFTKSVE